VVDAVDAAVEEADPRDEREEDADAEDREEVADAGADVDAADREAADAEATAEDGIESSSSSSGLHILRAELYFHSSFTFHP